MTNFDKIAQRTFGMGESKQELIYNVINERVSNNVPMIVTTNIPIKALTSSEDISCRRIYSRLMGKSFPIKFDGADKRIENMKKSFSDNRALLGL